jgi:cyclophilin family peptidyl-prolyl cis-trans isomerase
MWRALLALTCMFALMGFAPQQNTKTTMVVDVANRGKIEILLRTDLAPKTTDHIIKLAESGFYNGQKWFRVVKDPRPFLIQMGDPASRTKPMNDPSLGSGGSGAKIPYEDTGLSNNKGMVGLATPKDKKDEGDSQFYILLDNQRFLDGSYTVFGQVVSDWKVVQAVELGDQVTSVTIKRG